MNRFLPFVVALLLVFSSCAPATELQEITLAPPVTAPVTSSPTPTETPTQIPDLYRIENGVPKEFSSGSYVEIESLGEKATYELENGVLVAYYHPDREMFDVLAEGYKIGIRENGKWKFTEDTNFAFTLQPKQLKTLAEYLRDVNRYPNVSGENMVRHEIQIMRFGEFIGSRLETNLQTNHGKLQFIMLNTDKGFNEAIYLEPPEIAYRPASHTLEGTTTWINGELTVEEISQILDRYQETTPHPAGTNSYSGRVFTPGLDKWIDEKVKEGNDLETVCSWLGVPVIYNSPTIIDFCKNQHNNPDRKITSKNQFNDYIDSFKINPTTPIEQVEWWKPGVPILKSDTNFWFYISLSNLSGKSN